MRYRFFVLCVALLNATPILSQTQGHWQLTLLSGEVRSNIELNDVKDTLLIFTDSTGNRTVCIDSIAELRFVRYASFWDGAKTGAIIGSAVGVVGGAVFSKPGGELLEKPEEYRPLAAIAMGIGLGVVCGLIGGTISVLNGIDDVFDLSYMPLAGKLTTIRVVLAREKKE